MVAKIYQPALNAMQSGKAANRKWVLKYALEDSKFIDSVTGWTSSEGTLHQVKLEFDSKEQAEFYAKKNSIEYQLVEPKTGSLKKQSYSDNFM